MNLYLLAQFNFQISLQQNCKNTLSFIVKDPVCSMSLNSDKITANKLGQAAAKLTRNCWSWTKLFFQKCFYSSNFACLARNNMNRKHLRSAFSIHTKFQHNPPHFDMLYHRTRSSLPTVGWSCQTILEHVHSC